MHSQGPTPHRQSRRKFAKQMVVAASTLPFARTFIPAHAMGKLEKPALAAIGTGGKGQSDLQEMAGAGMQVVALVDVVDGTRMGGEVNNRMRGIPRVRASHPQARFFRDYREMFESMGDRVDAVTVSTPDHHHFHASSLALRAGKHVYCQKPLTRSLWEARELARLAEEAKVVTQMGNQAHANDHLRRCVELIRAGVVGKVQEIHAWTNRPIWPQGFNERPQPEPVPAWLDWEQWVGPAAWADYSHFIAPFAWRGWWNYGTGALGDMACHIMDMGFWAMQPAAPTAVQAAQAGATELSPPINSKITWDFPENPYSTAGGFQYFWYDGYLNAHFQKDGWQLIKQGEAYNHPDDSVLEGLSFEEYNCVVVGERGKLFFNQAQENWLVKPSHILDGFAWPEPSLPRAIAQNNYREFADAISGAQGSTQSNFGYAAALTETILLGVLAQRVPDTKLVWDAERLAVQGRPDLAELIKPPYRPGWEVA